MYIPGPLLARPARVPAESWITRHGSARSGFRYRDAAGASVTSATTLARIAALAIPPAWRDVHVAASPRAAVQAWGVDAKGRKQYRYHERAVHRGEQRKYYRVRRLARDLPRIRLALRRDLARRDADRARVAAAVVLLINEGFFRVGSERYTRQHGTYGITTLRKSHVRVAGDTLVFSFRGKSGVPQRHVVVDRALARAVAQLGRAPGRRLFRYRDETGWHDLTAREVNDYIGSLAGVRYTAKDFRTWGGTLRAATVLADLGPAASEHEAQRNVVTTVRLVASELGNTPAICRASYVHPIVLARYLDAGDTIGPLRSRGTPRTQAAGHSPEERALIAFLDRHFPERRRRLRAEELAA